MTDPTAALEARVCVCLPPFPIVPDGNYSRARHEAHCRAAYDRALAAKKLTLVPTEEVADAGALAREIVERGREIATLRSEIEAEHNALGRLGIATLEIERLRAVEAAARAWAEADAKHARLFHQDNCPERGDFPRWYADKARSWTHVETLADALRAALDPTRGGRP